MKAFTLACVFPMQPYNPHDLTPSQHEAVRQGLYLAARFDGLSEDEAEEAASQFYAHWLSRAWGRLAIARGDHARAFYSVRSYARLSRWHGFTGQRRMTRGKRAYGSDGNPVKVSVRKAGQEEIAYRERLKERNLPLPHDAPVGLERIMGSPNLRRKAERLAKRIGLTMEGMIREACGFCAD